jgi:hypothetical protein
LPKRLSISLLILIVLLNCSYKKINIGFRKDLLSKIRAIVILPIKSNFGMKNFQKYRIMIGAAENISLFSNYFVITSNEYEIEEGCPLNEIFICSNLKNLLKEADIQPFQILLLEFNIIEETEYVVSELSGRKRSSSETSADSNMMYKLITKGYHYSETNSIFEERYKFKPDISSDDILEPMYNYQSTLLKNLVKQLNEITRQSSTELNIKYYINHFQAVYPHNNSAKLCNIEKGDIDKEVEAEMIFDIFYKHINDSYVKIMKNYYCGILIENSDKLFDKNSNFHNGDLIISYCGKPVYGFYSIKNAIIASWCDKLNNSTIIRGSDRIDINL